MEAFLLIFSFAVILAGALLFTNAVEWIGHKLSLGEGAVGSLLAAVGTAMPETLIAVVALGGPTKSEDGAIGAGKLMQLGATCDHRILDGADAAVMAKTLRTWLEQRFEHCGAPGQDKQAPGGEQKAV